MRGWTAVWALAVASLTVGAAACAQIVGLEEPDLAPAAAVGEEPAPDATADDIEVTPPAIDFGPVTCGAEPTNVPPIVIRNKGTTTPRYSVQIPEGSAFELRGPLTGEIAPGAVVTIGVAARPNVPGDNATDVIVSVGSTLAQIALKAFGEGGRLEITPSVADLGAVRRENGGSLEVAFTNTGTKPLALVGLDSTSPEFDATWAGEPAPLALAPGAPQNVTAKLAIGDDSAPLTAELTPRLDGAYCGKPPILPVKGQRVNLDVTISRVDFGNHYCNTTPTLQQDVVISNYTPSTLSYTAALRSGASSAFTIVSGATGTLAAGTSQTPTTKAVRLGLKPVGAKLGAITEDVDITVNGVPAPSGGVRTVTASASVRGIVLTVNPSSATGFTRYQKRTIGFTNSGNEPLSLGSSFSRTAGTVQKPAWVFSWPGSLGAGATRSGSLEFRPDYYDRGTYAGTFTFRSMSAVPICNGTPTLAVQGTY